MLTIFLVALLLPLFDDAGTVQIYVQMVLTWNDPRLQWDVEDSSTCANAIVNIMKEGKVKKARRKDSPKPAEPQSGARRTVKLLPGAEALAKPLPRKRAAPASARARALCLSLLRRFSHT